MILCTMGKHTFNDQLAKEARERRDRALKLRDKGKSWGYIADVYGVSRSRAKQMVERAQVDREKAALVKPAA